MNVAIVTDSTSDLERLDAAALGVDVVPLFVEFGDERFADMVDLTREGFYRRLQQSRDTLPRTSQPTAAMFEAAFRPHVEAGRPIACLTISAALSGTINAATAAARTFPGAEIAIVDSWMVSGGLTVQVAHAAELAAAGASFGEVRHALHRDRQIARGYAVVPDLSHAVRTGRISRSQAFIGSLVKILPVLRFADDRIEEEARVRTFARAQDAMLEAALRAIDAAPGARVAIAHAHVEPLAQNLAARLRERATQPLHSLEIYEAGPVIATHAGEGAVGIFVLPGA